LIADVSPDILCENLGEDMNRKTRAMLLTLLLSVSIFVIACPKRVSIADIEANPARYQNKSIAVAGIVKTSYGVSIPFSKSGGGAYKISDGTGSIWVITKKGVPSKNSQLGVKGKIQNGATYKGKHYGLVLIEDKRKFKKN